MNHQTTRQGLWYDCAGSFTGLIHGRFSFCQNHSLAMEFDPEVAGYISAVETLEQLFVWFSREDIMLLQRYGFYIHEYRAEDYKWYDRFSHYLINEATSAPLRKLAIDSQGRCELPQVLPAVLQ